MANIYGRPKAYVSFQVRVSPDLKERLARRSFETGVSQAAIVIASLEHYLDVGLTPQGEPDEDLANLSSGEGGECSSHEVELPEAGFNGNQIWQKGTKGGITK